MNGIDKIIARMEADTQAECADIAAQAAAEAEAILARYRAEADKLLREGEARCKVLEHEQVERLEGGSRLACRQRVLAEKQRMLDEAFARAADALCGGQAPSFHALRDRLEHIDARVLAWHPSAGTDPLVSPPSSPASLSSPPPPSFSSREQAYASLSAIADYLMRTEPHSPAPWLVKRAVSWGGMTLAELLDELLGQGENLASIKKLLGMTKE